MAIDYLIGWTQAELETELRRCQEERLRGKTLVTSSAGDVSFGHNIQFNINERIALILRKLSTIDPVTYPPESTTPIDRTEIVFPQFLGSPPVSV